MRPKEPVDWRVFYDDVARSGSAQMDYSTVRRQQEEWLILLRFAGPIAGAEICDAACGYGGLTQLAVALGARRVVAFDQVKVLIEGARARAVDPHGVAEFHVAEICDAARADWAGSGFDAVVCAEALHCVGVSDGLEALWPLVRPGGRLVAGMMANAASFHNAEPNPIHHLVDQAGLTMALRRLPGLATSRLTGLRVADDQRIEIFDSRRHDDLNAADGFVVVAVRGS